MYLYRAKIKNSNQTKGLRQSFLNVNDCIKYAKEEQKKPFNKNFTKVEIYSHWVENGKNKEKLLFMLGE